MSSDVGRNPARPNDLVLLPHFKAWLGDVSCAELLPLTVAVDFTLESLSFRVVITEGTVDDEKAKEDGGDELDAWLAAVLAMLGVTTAMVETWLESLPAETQTFTTFELFSGHV